MTLAAGNHLLFPRCSQTILRTLWSTMLIHERLAHGSQGPRAEFIEVTPCDAKRAAYLSSGLAFERCQHRMQTSILFGGKEV